ncbi:ribosome maturation factor RimM [Mycetocola reblochoni]|uniref:Ribosome maturation factor RimM n=2 Tax=Mycetocola reblochoni TaxID=331618 RepID=A0A1R4JBP8_9MICO|nr:ribosome maturation factor RimM [Mycetocola reblochoni]RLP69993.1 ribosome maturation factor RimM [Mycetocola reblochoni]SJN29468.1 16S rRNA processing protein RimM [Mycetocola reblochoni REB411]
MNAATTPAPQLRVGRLTKAHGLKGAIKLELFTDDPEKRFVPGAVFTLQVPTSSPWHGRTLTLTQLRWFNSHPVGFFDGVDDRTAAEGLAKAILWIDDDSDEDQEDDAWHHHQLIGLDVVRDGVVLGTVARIDHLPAQDLLAVDTASGEVLVPFVRALVPEVDVAGGRIVVTPPAGLFEEVADGADDDADTGTDDGADTDGTDVGSD